MPENKAAGTTVARRPAEKTSRGREDQRSSLECTASTAIAAQRFRILDALGRGPKTSYELRRLGCYQAPTRIHELRQAGHVIYTARVTVVDAQGYSHRGVALYELVVPPAGKVVR